MKQIYNYILSILAVAMLVSCQDDYDTAERDVQFAVRAAWQNGRAGGASTRVLSATDILAGGTDDIAIDFADYPATIDIHCSDGTDFTLTKGDAKCAEHTEYWSYTPSVIYKDIKIKRDNLTFTATAILDDVIDGIDGTVKGMSGYADIDNRHMLLTLHHTHALLRFAFRVDARYDLIRYIRVTGIELNGQNCTMVDKVLNKDNMTLVGYAYIDPQEVTTASTNTIKCTYNIYDKDADFGPSKDEAELKKHLAREGVIAQNTFQLGMLKDIDGNPVTDVQAGYYYDLHVTLNPDYLYVLTDHDDKHLTVD